MFLQTLRVHFFMKPNRDQLNRLLHSNWIHLAMLIALCSGVCEAQNGKLSTGKLAKIDATVSKFMASTHVPGVSEAVVENGEHDWDQGFGFADLENNVPAGEHTLFRLASISKSLTAAAAMEVWERGRLDLDAPVQKYCPSFPQKLWPISVRQVLGPLVGFATTNPACKMIPKSATRNALTIPSRLG